MKKTLTKIEVSPSIAVWTFLILLGLVFLYLIKDVIVLFFIALVLSAAIEPVITKMVAWKISRTIAVTLIYLLVIAIFGGVLSYIVPTVITEGSALAKDFPRYMEEIAISTPFFADMAQNMAMYFNSNSFAEGFFTRTASVFYGVIGFVAVFAVAFYLSIEEKGMEKFLRIVTPKQYQKYVVDRAYVVHHKIGNWMVGQLFLMFVIFILYYILLSLLQIPNAFILALLGGLFEIVPYIGPVIGAVPAVIAGFFISPWAGVAIMIGYILIQQIENHILIPQIMKRFVGLNPIASILALLIGAKIGGVMGAILAIPVATMIGVFVKDAIEGRAHPKKTE